VKVLFAGPTLFGVRTDPFENRGPAQQGDVTKAVLDGATAIGLVDGVFEHASTVWHKEILFALSEGVSVLGAASIGALRAAECHPFGMMGIGRVFELYAAGAIRDDDAVAQLHAPAELNYAPLTEALVNIMATLDDLLRRGVTTGQEHHALTHAAERLFFKDRTFKRVVASARLPDEPRALQLVEWLERGRVDVKRQDAMKLLAFLANLPVQRGPRPDWEFASTPMFRAIRSRLRPDTHIVADGAV
jgi:hypothetical protein